MADTEKMQANGQDGREGKPDGVNDVKPASSGESAGGAYPNPHDQKDTEGKDRFDGGQSGKDYTGAGQIGGKPVPGSSGGQGG